MTEKKIELKFGRHIRQIGKDDLILDNGQIVQIVTQKVKSNFTSTPVRMSKKDFRAFKTCAFIFIDEKKTEEARKFFGNSTLTYYRFDIDRMSKFYKTIDNK